ncbi:MAG: 30S ribosomal protein S1 [candidate division Zixibacteria bacterium]|nr:30S ribosomal protein S1 [candidate division Zixibacteria bacterium]MBU1471562.1 30S ribosomal protein S1 [candidate division Zixibacteria bacterium]MBU2626337.1 30S ribosomal protein S1 [candidate division Zixibacteria bacterium]
MTESEERQIAATAKSGGDANPESQPTVRLRTKKGKAGQKKERTSKAEQKGHALVTERAKQIATAETSRRRRVSQKAAERSRIPVASPDEIATVDAIKLTDLDRDEYSPEEFSEMLAMYDETLSDIKEGEIVQGTVMGVTRDDVIVDVGFKSEGIISMSEFPEPIQISVGDSIEVYLEAVEDQNGQLVLSKQKADFLRVWDNIRDAHESGNLVPGRLQRRIKGGIVVDLFGVDAFLPGSQIALRQVPNFDELIGKVMELKIIKLNKNRRNIVVSRRVVLEEEREHLRQQLLKEIDAGQVREGTVKNITDFGVFIDLGGVDGLLHITDMSWGRVSHPSEMVSLGDKINVKILDFVKDTGRISLGLKQLTPYPWENIEEKYPVGRKISGLVVSLTDYGAFIELEKGIEGLIHISEMSWTQHVKHPSKLMQVSDSIEAVVLSVDKENEKISLGIKQMEPDPWRTLDEKYPAGARVSGKVRNLTTFGAFIELEEGIDGLVHISDMSWTKRIQHPSEVMKKGDVVDVVVLRVDKDNRRISLGFKQLSEDPWPQLSKNYAVGAEALGQIIRLLDRGVIVELPGGVEGFVSTNQLGRPDLEKPSDNFQINDELPLQVVEFDQPGRKIVLSVDAYYRQRERTELDQYLAKHESKGMTIGEAVGEEVPAGSKTSEVAETSPEDAAAVESQPSTEEAGVPEPGEPIAEASEPIAEVSGEEASEEPEDLDKQS